MTSKKKPSERTELAPRSLDLGQIERLLSFMSEHGLDEFEYSQGDLHIRLKRPAANSVGAVPRVLTVPEIVVPGPSAPPSAEAAPASGTVSAPPREPAAEPARGEDLHIVKSPIVGTFYHAPNPGAEPFVKVGDTVEAGQVLCIIEAMKLMNEIESDQSGEVVRIFIESGQPVEYGESLFGIRLSRKR